MTEWTSFSRIENSIITEYHFTFDLDESYIYSKKVRSWSDEQELFVHNSGDFAVEIFSAGFSFYTRKTDIELVSAMEGLNLSVKVRKRFKNHNYYSGSTICKSTQLILEVNE